jgi:cellulose synthase/poly-beta-1,6-N-acetylglucosamine synthase-like glycosyltransferase
MILLASEERAGQEAQEVASKIKEKYEKQFYRFFITVHPDGLPGEIKGKSANASYAVQAVLPELEGLNIGVDQVLVANFDSDTIVHPQYFARVMYEFLTAEKPYRSSYQPIEIYNNNIWDSPAFIRVVSVSNSFWQFTEGSRPDRLRTFSSHSMTLRALTDIGFWKKDIVNEDAYVYWQSYLHYKGDYHVVPLLIPVSLDTCLAETFWQTLKNQYKQKRRWAYNVEYYPHLIPQLLKSDAPFFDRMYKLYQYVEGNFNWATASILISSLGWLPLILGGREFLDTVVAFNLPLATKVLMNIATIFLIFSVYINLILLPPRPKRYGKMRSVMMYLQWFLVPITSVVFGSLPAIEAQTRLMLGWYLEFWVTPKARKGENTALQMKEMQATISR